MQKCSLPFGKHIGGSAVARLHGLISLLGVLGDGFYGDL
jgi:hypothetical protein